MEKLRLVRPEKIHEEQAIAYIKELCANDLEVHGVGGLERYKDDYDGWLEKLAADRAQVPNKERVPTETFFLMKDLLDQPLGFGDDAERLVGMVNIRLALNDNLWVYDGNIGYSIRPSERRKGYNKVNLFLALCFCQNRDIDAVLLTCNKNNLGSEKTMQALGGKLIWGREHEFRPGEIGILQHYVIDVDDAIAKHGSQYSRLIAEYPD